MKPNKPLLLATLLCAAIGANGIPAQEHAHEHAHAAHAPAAADGVLHATDASLRAGMLKLRDLLAAPRPADAAAAKILADGIDGEVQQLFVQCKLEPEADAALHGVLALLLEGAAGLRADAADDAAWDQLQQALKLYPQRFDDAQFSAGR